MNLVKYLFCFFTLFLYFVSFPSIAEICEKNKNEFDRAKVAYDQHKENVRKTSAKLDSLYRDWETASSQYKTIRKVYSEALNKESQASLNHERALKSSSINFDHISKTYLELKQTLLQTKEIRDQLVSQRRSLIALRREIRTQEDMLFDSKINDRYGKAVMNLFSCFTKGVKLPTR